MRYQRRMRYQKKLQKLGKALCLLMNVNDAMTMESNKTPGADGLTSVFYRYFWKAVKKTHGRQF